MGPAQAQGGAGCYLEGTATFKPGLTNDAQDFTYSFKGTLMGCMSNESDAPAGGTVSAGQVLPLKVKGQNMKFQEPVPSGNGSCGNGHTDGIAIVQWDGGAYSVVKYGTDSATG